MRLNNLEKQAHSEALQLNTVLATSNAGERFTPSVQLLYDGEKHFSLCADATQVLKLLLKKADQCHGCNTVVAERAQGTEAQETVC